ncbi:lytic transglycosylase domain-containing protein [Novosphingobium sp. FKTRR1]|uniref:lytic transglycosylase domain-containing protein n=1 Tax=Novosphingobium sp. FKTRR1 TaxID=2879118 RepID=UPI001CF05B99|nr:lytic transglycosylase domain-containing protein [Novosphingobium sp. FKTRR1]
MTRLLLIALPVALAAAWPSRASTGATAPNVSAIAATGSSGVTVQTGEGGFALLSFGMWPAQKSDRQRSRDRSIVELSKPALVSHSKVGSFRRAIYLPHVMAAERQYALPPGLLDALIWTESRYNPFALSKAGAVGLGQLMAGTARQVGVRNRYDPLSNVGGAALYLRTLLDQFGMVHLAVAAYNAGPKAVTRAGGIPRNGETPIYVRQVLRYWRL